MLDVILSHEFKTMKCLCVYKSLYIVHDLTAGGQHNNLMVIFYWILVQCPLLSRYISLLQNGIFMWQVFLSTCRYI